MKYTKSLDHALMATYYANKAAKTKSLTAKRMFQKKALASILEAGKQSDAKYGMRVLEASLRLAAENEGLVPAEDQADEMVVEDDVMPIEAEAEAEEDEDLVDEDEDDEDEDEESDDAELDAAFNRVLARARSRKVKAAARARASKSRIR